MTELEHVTKQFVNIARKNHLSYGQLKYMFSNIRRSLELEPTKKRRNPIELLTAIELETLVSTAYAKKPLKGLMVRTLLLTGARVNEFRHFKIMDFNFEESEIFIRVGKGKKSRTVPILPSLSRELQMHRGNRKLGWLFETQDARQFSVRRIQQIIKEVAKAAGITKRVYPHLLRHQVATYLINNDMPENHLQKFLGHSEPSTTQLYAQLAIEPVKKSYNNAFNESREK